MSFSRRQLTFIFCALLLPYVGLAYVLTVMRANADFATHYAAILALAKGFNPYGTLEGHFVTGVTQFSSELNPPFVLWLLSPLAHLSYSIAIVTLSYCSLGLGLLALRGVVKECFAELGAKEKYLISAVYFLTFFPVILNTALGQLGLLVFFLMAVGYVYYARKKYSLTLLLWSLAAAMKFFPLFLVLLFVFDRQIRLAALFLLAFLCWSLMPMLVYGVHLYHDYFNLIQGIGFYGENWNASVLGFVYRLMFFLHAPNLVKPIYIGLFLVCTLSYVVYGLKTTANSPLKKQHLFILNVVLMLYLSPLGWNYYFALLIIPILWQARMILYEGASLGRTLLFFFMLFMISFPSESDKLIDSYSFHELLISGSLYFYGLSLCLVNTITMSSAKERTKNTISHKDFFLLISLSLLLGYLSFIVKVARAMVL